MRILLFAQPRECYQCSYGERVKCAFKGCTHPDGVEFSSMADEDRSRTELRARGCGGCCLGAFSCCSDSADEMPTNVDCMTGPLTSPSFGSGPVAAAGC
jgi:hypothetical protein